MRVPLAAQHTHPTMFTETKEITLSKFKETKEITIGKF